MQVFDEFDLDGSGFLDFDEFTKMLPALGIYMAPPKIVCLLHFVLSNHTDSSLPLSQAKYFKQVDR